MSTFKYRRVLALVMAICLLAAVIAGCGQENTPTEPDGTKPSETQTATEKPTVPPETEPPTTEPPETEPPATEPPATEPPATEPPATEPPATKPPATEPPATEPSDNVLDIVMPTPGADGTFQADTEFIFGVGYVEDQMNNRVQVDQAVYLIRAMGIRSVRIWTGCMSDSRTLIPWRVERLHDLIGKLQDADIQVIFNVCGFESPQMGGLTTWIPARDLTDGSDYLTAVSNFETMFFTLAAEFPEVRYWEVGNEWNHNPFMHPIGWKEDGTGTPSFTMKEKAYISADLMRAATKGIRDAGNTGLIISPAMAPADGMDGVAMSDWLDYVYEAIESGACGTTNPRDFFEALSWHPYFVAEPDQEWVENNNRLYRIAVDHGDAGIKVFLTEYGFPDNGNSRADAVQAEWMVKAYTLVRRYMPYVESLHYYRLFTDTSRGADTYGLINQPEDGFGPKAKGLAYQKMAGGQGDLYRFYMPLYEED
ncbi:MAG: cellulase family glycosylhydrolase [Firmicutes bacterium]|nr:cellulase family glycosylhydrolase [Bacillota bacterium]